MKIKCEAKSPQIGYFKLKKINRIETLNDFKNPLKWQRLKMREKIANEKLWPEYPATKDKCEKDKLMQVKMDSEELQK